MSQRGRSQNINKQTEEMNKLDPVKISDTQHGIRGVYVRGETEYRVRDLIEMAKDLPVFEIPMQSIDLSVVPWGDMSIKNFVFHAKKLNETKMDYPILLDNDGAICDGYHRIARAIMEGRTIIKAQRLEVMPEPVEDD